MARRNRYQRKILRFWQRNKSQILLVTAGFLVGRLSVCNSDSKQVCGGAWVPPESHKIQYTYDYQGTGLEAKIEPWLGSPYLWGGESKNGVDCSGFVKNIYAEYGIKLPRTSYEQHDVGEAVIFPEKGDLVFFNTHAHPNKDVSHVGIFMGNDVIAHACSAGVEYASLSALKRIYPYKGARRYGTVR